MSKEHYQFRPAPVAEPESKPQSVAVEEPKPAEPQAEVTIRLPDKWTVAAYETYVDGKQMYYDRCAAETPVRAAPEVIARFHGALALIKSQVVHVDGLDILMKAVAEQNIADMAVIGFIVRAIASPVEMSVYLPLPNWIVL